MAIEYLSRGERFSLLTISRAKIRHSLTNAFCIESSKSAEITLCSNAIQYTLSRIIGNRVKLSDQR